MNVPVESVTCIVTVFPEQMEMARGSTIRAYAFLTVMGYTADTGPFPQELVPYTVRFPEVALAAKSMVTAFPVPLTVAPVPE